MEKVIKNYVYCHITLIKGSMAVVEVDQWLASKIGINMVSVYNLSHKWDKFMFNNIYQYISTLARVEDIDITITRV